MSESDEMPADIRETVRVLFRNMVVGDPVIQTVERAILAERERCATIAETAELPDEDGEYWLAIRIARAIRQGDAP